MDNIEPYRNRNRESAMEQFVIHRDGTRQEISFDKISKHVKKLCLYPHPLDKSISFIDVVKVVCMGVIDGITTHELNELAAETAQSKVTYHPDYGVLAGRIAIANYHKRTHDKFSDLIYDLYHYINPNTDQPGPLISRQVYETVMANRAIIDNAIHYERDYNYNYFAYMTLRKGYLMQMNKECVERPQHLFMRVGLGIHRGNIAKAVRTYNALSNGEIMHATPTLFNMGTPKGACASCYLVEIESDSIKGIYDTNTTCALISKNAGGIGLNVSKIRSNGSYIAGTGGISNGVVPFLKSFEATARAVNQSGKRKGSIACYIEPWHADIEDFIKLGRPNAQAELSAVDLFYGLWIPDIFMNRVFAKKEWTLFSPVDVPKLFETYGDEYEEWYIHYERTLPEKKKRSVSAWDLMNEICKTQIQTGRIYMLYSDSVNRKSNQKNIGKIEMSNLCTEIVEFTSPTEVAMCNLCTVSLSKCLKEITQDDGSIIYEFDHRKLFDLVVLITDNLNKIIDLTYYPVYQGKLSNLRHRPIGIGVQGLADVFALMKWSFTSPEAKQLNKEIFETMSFAFNTASMTLAKKRSMRIDQYRDLLSKQENSQLSNIEKTQLDELEDKLYPNNLYSEERDSETDRILKEIKMNELNSEETWKGAYSTFPGSPVSQGEFQHDMWIADGTTVTLSGRWDWDALREQVMIYGIRNSLGISLQPTATSSNIAGNQAAAEPFISNIYNRRVLSGEFTIVNEHLVRDLSELGLWDPNLKNAIQKNRGSIQNIDGIPDDIKERYRTVWEISNKDIIEMSADRAPFICQTQSLNLFLEAPTVKKVRTLHKLTYTAKLKTGQYYLRSRPALDPVQFTVQRSSSPIQQSIPVQRSSSPTHERLDESSADVLDDEDATLNYEDMDPTLVCSLENRDACMMCE